MVLLLLLLAALVVLGIVLADFHPEPPRLFTHARYIAAAALSAGLVLWAHLDGDIPGPRGEA